MLIALGGSAHAQSTFTKRGTDATTRSTATAGGAGGTTAPGRTLDWVLSYRNTTGTTANVSITDLITGNQRFVPGSLKTPPGLSPRWSTNGGASYVGAQPAAGVNAVGASGTNTDGSTGEEDLFSPPIQSFSAGSAAGDGWEAMFIGDNIYNVFHHRAGALATIDCHVKATGATCAGFPVQYVSPDAGDPLGTGPDTLMTATSNNGAYDPATGRIFFAAGVNGSTSIGVACADIVAMESCGYTQLATTNTPNDTAPGNPSFGQPGIAGGSQVGNRFYTVAANAVGAPVLCYDISTLAACAGWPVGGAPSVPTYPGSPGTGGSLESWGGYVFTNVVEGPGPGFPRHLGCVVAATGATCPGFPIVAYTTWNGGQQNRSMAPLLDASGDVTGICAQKGVDLSSGTYACYSLTGTPLGPAPWGQMVPNATAGLAGVLSPLAVGTRLYIAYNGNGTNIATYTCWDFATSAACQGFVPVSSGADVRPYSLRQDPQNPDCIWELGDAGRFEVFSATFGGAIGCNVGNAQVRVTPGELYCDGQGGHVTAWNQLRIGRVTAADYESIAVTITDANGDPVPGWTNRVIDSADVPVDISSIPHAGSTTALNVAVVINWGGNPDQPATAFATYTGDPIQVCFKTTVGAARCSAARSIDDTASAVTTVVGGPSSTRGSGTARFTLPANASLCTWDLGIVKEPRSELLIPGKTARYGLTVRNFGPDTARNVVVKDRLPSGLSFVSASSGCAEESAVVTCTVGSLAVGASQTFEVVARVGRSVSHSKKNAAVVCSDKPSAGPASTACAPPPECELGQRCVEQPCAEPGTATQADPRANAACAKIPIAPKLRITKKVNKKVVRAGGLLVFTIRTSNPSDITLHNVKTCDRLPAGLVYVSSRPRAKVSRGQHCWTVKRLGAHRSKTYKVTVRALNGARGRLTNPATAAADDARPARAKRSVRVIAGGALPEDAVTG